jgi:hypothetical protein
VQPEGKRKRHDRGAPAEAGQSVEPEEQEDAVERVEQDADRVMAAGFRPKSEQSSACEIQVSGYQLLECEAISAQRAFPR